MNFARALQQARTKAGIQQNELAAKTGYSQTYISLIEKGKKEPTMRVIEAIAKALLIPVTSLLLLAIDEDDIPASKQPFFFAVYPILEELLDISLESGKELKWKDEYAFADGIEKILNKVKGKIIEHDDGDASLKVAG